MGLTTRTVILNVGNQEEKRAEILDYFRKTYALDDELYTMLAREAAFYLTVWRKSR